MRSKFGRWGLTVLTMASIATAVLFATSGGSASATTAAAPVYVVNGINGVTPVQVAQSSLAAPFRMTPAWPTDGLGDPYVAVRNFPSTQSVSGTVTVGNPAKTVVISGSVIPRQTQHEWVLVQPTDLSAYRSVMLYTNLLQPSQNCTIMTQLPSGAWYDLTTFGGSGPGQTTEGEDPAPPNIAVTCTNDDPNDPQGNFADYMLVGRTG